MYVLKFGFIISCGAYYLKLNKRLGRVHKSAGIKYKNEIRTCGFIVVYIDSLQLEVRVTMVGTSWVNAVFIRDHFPELKKQKINAFSNLRLSTMSPVNAFSNLRLSTMSPEYDKLDSNWCLRHIIEVKL